MEPPTLQKMTNLLEYNYMVGAKVSHVTRKSHVSKTVGKSRDVTKDIHSIRNDL